MLKAKKPEIPLHTKWGIRVSLVIILLIMVMILKNCIGSVMYGISTDQEMQTQYYELGYSHGRQKALGFEKQTEPETENLLLRKMYRKGYRDGWDSAQTENNTGKLPDSPGGAQ